MLQQILGPPPDVLQRNLMFSISLHNQDKVLRVTTPIRIEFLIPHRVMTGMKGGGRRGCSKGERREWGWVQHLTLTLKGC